jgi:hypothetical protein
MTRRDIRAWFQGTHSAVVVERAMSSLGSPLHVLPPVPPALIKAARRPNFPGKPSQPEFGS